MARRRVGAEDGEEVREAVHGDAHVHLRASSLVPDVVDFLAAAPRYREGVQPLRSLEAVGEDDDVGWERGGFFWCLLFVWGRECAAWTEGYRVGGDGCEREGGEFDSRVVEPGEPCSVEDTPFATDAVVRR